MNAIDNANLIDMCRDCGAAGFIPGATYTYNAATGAVVVTDATTVPAGDTYNKMKVQVCDQFGNEVRGTISAVGGAVTISALGLNRSEELDIKVVILTTNNIYADGGVYDIRAAGNLSHWDVQKNA